MSLKSFLKNVRWLWKDGVEERLRDDIIARIFYEIRPKIKNHRETIDRLVETKQSIARFGDGEIAIIQGGSIPFQKYEKRLAERLRSILKNDNPNLLVGVNYEYFYPPQANMIEGVSSFYKNCAKTLKKALLPCLDLNKQYYSAGFTQLSMFFSDYDFNSHYERLRQIWGGGRILMVTNKAIVDKCSYNIFDNAKEIAYLYIPSKDAYGTYDEILSQAVAYDKDTLIVVAAGPCGKVLADDLSKMGYRVLDLGHLMKDYDWWRKGKERNERNLVEFCAPD